MMSLVGTPHCLCLPRVCPACYLLSGPCLLNERIKATGTHLFANHETSPENLLDSRYHCPLPHMCLLAHLYSCSSNSVQPKSVTHAPIYRAVVHAGMIPASLPHPCIHLSTWNHHSNKLTVAPEHTCGHHTPVVPMCTPGLYVHLCSLREHLGTVGNLGPS
jgi:hypothetical protein